jgi:glycosyltransferase involved in cell wall biosynthesis
MFPDRPRPLARWRRLESMPDRSPVRVLRAIARLNIGGPARHVTLLDDGLRARGFETFLVYGDPGEGEGTLEYLVRELNLPGMRVPGLGRAIRLDGDFRAFLTLLRIVFARQPDVVHTHTAKAGTLGRIAAGIYNLTRSRSRRCAIVHTYHGHVFEGYFGQVGSAVVRTIERTLARFTDRVVTISERQREDIVSRFRIAPAHKTVVVPLGLRLDSLLSLPATSPEAKRRHQLPPDATVFGFIGRLVPIKDVPTLLRAVGIAVKDEASIHVAVFGDGPERAAITSLIREMQLDRRVTLAGWHHDLPSIYAALDAVVLTSLNEGTPVALIEAMAAGRSVIATDVGGVRDVIEPNVTGLLVPRRDPARLAAAMVQLARSPALRQRFGEQGRRQARERFGTTRLVNEIASLYEDCLSRRRGLAKPSQLPLLQ